MNIRDVTTDDTDQVAAFLSGLSEQDLTLIREELHASDQVTALLDSPDSRWIATNDDDRIIGYATVHQLPGFSNHVGELRLVSDPEQRGKGIGKALAKHALTESLRAGMSKVVIELAADQDHAITMLSGLGFTGEALLRDHIRDRAGQLHDLVILAHLATEEFATLDAVGITDALR